VVAGPWARVMTLVSARGGAPGSSPASHAPLPSGNSRITVELRLNLAISAPSAYGTGSASGQYAGSPLGFSPRPVVLMLDTLSAPTSTSAIGPSAVSNQQTTRSLRQKRFFSPHVVAAFTLNRRPGM